MAVFKPTQEEINQYLARFEGDVPLTAVIVRKSKTLTIAV